MGDSESIYPGGPRYRPRKWHRRKSVMGKDWTPPRMQDIHAGVWCKIHGVRHPYNGKGKVAAQYEKRGEAWVILWLCPITCDVIGELYLGGNDGNRTDREEPRDDELPGADDGAYDSDY